MLDEWTVRWVESWLERWAYSFVVSITKSSQQLVAGGLPQGSVPGPVMFNFFVKVHRSPLVHGPSHLTGGNQAGQA